MTIKKFIEAQDIVSIKAIWRAKLIAERHDDHFIYRLFKVDDFYVEAKISPTSLTRHFTAYETLEVIMPLYTPNQSNDILTVVAP